MSLNGGPFKTIVFPEGKTPWLTATFIDKNPIIIDTSIINVVELTMDAGGLTGTEFVGQWLFNTTYTANLSFVYLSNPDVPEVAPGFGQNSFSAGPAKGFDILFDFDQAKDNRFSTGEKVVYDIYGQPNLTLLAENFNTLNDPGNEAGVYYSAAHVQGIKVELSGWIAATNGAKPVPEPTTMLLLGIGLTGLAYFARKKFLK